MAESKKLHITMFPWVAFGHIIPFLELGKLIGRKGHRVSFISTPKNIERLPEIPPDIATSLTLVKLPLPHVENLPENAEATMDVPYHLVPYLKIAHDGLQEPLSRFLESSTPDWIIHDFAPHWLPPIATKLGIPRVFFSIFRASSLCFFGPLKGNTDTTARTEPEQFTVPPKWVPFPSKMVFRVFEAKKLLDNFDENASGVSDWARLVSAASGAEAVAIKTCVEIESEWVKLLSDLYEMDVIPVGLLPPSTEESRNERDITWDTIVEWLEKQEKGSVVFIALGTEAQPSQQDFIELALGIEQSGLPFFWVIRRQSDSVGGDSVELPEGFEVRTKRRGVVWTSWAPQSRILAHDSVGGFLTHCGWSSVSEALQFGVALIMLPFWTDQGLIARFLEDRQAGVEVPRNEQDGSFTRDSVAQTMKLVMKEADGQIYRDKVKEMTTIFGDKDLQHQYVDKFVDFLEKKGHVS
ncbi:hypothetical protein I3760_08G140900 [Carya illinoinensis]|uniref:Uncharacterized protein n=1 Tax=Carya illinoinensis TaxID=32201 RepID=A0A8T1PV62_CARIL|nr:putative UDP-rhamnose:rhamnosyltransferase 1 [Carya illinoinensis]KAG2694374.1 hypothetical protein I3760_08G140900 [Carya illinoinensis]KAG6645724.1 hypothetical protein CIPAW_08G142000 [Carya illinoinensis]